MTQLILRIPLVGAGLRAKGWSSHWCYFARCNERILLDDSIDRASATRRLLGTRSVCRYHRIIDAGPQFWQNGV
jgi:hypothetical protein